MRRRRHKRSHRFDSDCASDCPNDPSCHARRVRRQCPGCSVDRADTLDLQTISQPSLKDEMDESCHSENEQTRGGW